MCLRSPRSRIKSMLYSSLTILFWHHWDKNVGTRRRPRSSFWDQVPDRSQWYFGWCDHCKRSLPWWTLDLSCQYHWPTLSSFDCWLFIRSLKNVAVTVWKTRAKRKRNHCVFKTPASNQRRTVSWCRRYDQSSVKGGSESPFIFWRNSQFLHLLKVWAELKVSSLILRRRHMQISLKNYGSPMVWRRISCGSLLGSRIVRTWLRILSRHCLTSKKNPFLRVL